MKLAVCVSNDMGILFNKRRQSRDAVLCQDIVNMANNNKLRIHPKSETLFQDGSYISSEAYMLDADSEDYCFYEGYGEIPWDKVSCIILYNWNRDYPSDAFFEIPSGYTITETTEFAGKSHPEIRKEIYKKK